MDGLAVRDSCLALAPEYEGVLLNTSHSADVTWHGPLANGKAVEVLGLCLLVAAARSLRLGIQVPILFSNDPDAFYWRNELPLSHPARAGHSDALDSATLERAYVAALTPKCILQLDARSWSVCREGIPIHSLFTYASGGSPPSGRPDLAVLEGSPAIELTARRATYSWTWGESTWQCELRMIDSPKPALLHHSDLAGGIAPVAALVECSHNKSASHVDGQLGRYLIDYPTLKPQSTMFLNGGSSLATHAGLNIRTINVVEARVGGAQTASVQEVGNWLRGCLAL